MIDLLGAELERLPDPASKAFKAAALAELEQFDANAAAERNSQSKE